MVDQRFCHELQSNEIIMESFRDMAISQEGRDRLKYMDIVTEAFSNPTKQASLINKLFKEIQKVEEIDFGKIPDSKGDLTKYVYYNQMYQCIEVLNNLVEDHPTPNITSMNKLHQILLSTRADFTFGFRTENFVIMNTYNLMVTSLYEMINVCVVDATEYLRAKLTMEVAAPTAKQIRWVTKTTNQYIKMYENGQWAILMKGFKSSGSSMSVASEATGIELRASLKTDAENAIKSTNLKETFNTAKDNIKDAYKEHPWAFRIVGGIAAIIALFTIIRSAVYYFINCAGKLSDRLKNITTILRANIASENSPTAVEKQKKLLQHLDNTADVIDYKIVKSEKFAENEIKKANKAEFNPHEITNISGSDFEI